MKCTNCGGKMVTTEKIFKREIAGVGFVIIAPALKCLKCARTVVTNENAAAGELAVASHLASHGPVSGASFGYMRRILQLSATEVGRLLKVGSQTISRWENGVREPDRSAWFALGSMVLDAAMGQSTTRSRLRVLGEGPTVAPVQVRGQRTATALRKVGMRE